MPGGATKSGSTPTPAPLANVAFGHSLDLEPQTGASPDTVAAAVALPPGWANLVFVDGVFSPALSSPMDDGWFAGSLAAALDSRQSLLEENLSPAGVFR